MDYDVIDSFLPEQDYLAIKNTLIDSNFPWYYNPFVATDDKDEKHFQFTHTFYRNNSFSSNFSYVLQPLIQKINPTALISIKANLGPVANEIVEQGFHTDKTFKCRTAVYYVNTNNGYTVFEDGTKIESVGNRFVEFDSLLPHSGTTHTDTKVRCVLNLNYYK